ncbi:serine/threonine-protein phosphatase 7 long form homolog [Chenopodium quinoa]|uniref:serine/threonine-protein phosphatase 7 long form homolog n=1 Tax=Chenopodium quinoa TaxID=63459 RepID=UPI000B794C84|nr:serine/threonine-protein phosphatase 7 long form homolog [Chenopodium quinoa]
MASNLRTHVKNNDMRDRFKAAAYQRQEKKLFEDMRSIGEACVKFLEYITDVPFHRWSLFHDAGRRHEIMEGQDQGQTRHNPGPADPSVLTLQDTHRSRDIWEQIGDPARCLVCRHHVATTVVDWVVDPRVLQYIDFVGFGGFHRMAFTPIDRALITALVERWRQETHSFHLPVGEATVTLRDVEILTRLPVHGRAVTGPIIQDPRGLVERVLGVRPEATDVRGTGLRHIWLRETFGVLPPDADDGVVQRYARAYLFMLIGSLFSNKSGSHIQLIYLQLLENNWEGIRDYSWGSACLATLYRHLCRASQRSRWEISGPLIVLQLWAWEHIHVGRPAMPARRRREEEEEDDQEHAYEAPPHPPPDLAYCCRWLGRRLTRVHAARGLPYYRDAFDRLSESQVIVHFKN